MYIEQIRHNPAPGKGQELRAALEEWARSAPSRGAAHNLTSAILDPEGAVFINGIRHQTLEAFGVYREQARQTSPYPQSLLARPPQRTLWQVLVPANLGSDPSRYIFRITFYPAVGKAAAVRRLLEDWVKVRQAGGSEQALMLQAFSQDGPVFAQNIRHRDLGSLEARIGEFQRDPSYAPYTEKLTPLLNRPSKSELFQILVPFPRPRA